MKGLILSGGKGTRLRPITHTSAKQLVPVANKPVLFYGIEAIRDSGIEEIGIVVGDTREEIQAAVGDGSRFGVKVTYIHQEEPKGLAHAVLVSEGFLKDDPFVMYLGDNLIIKGISALVDEFRNNRYNSQILLAHVPNPSQFGVAELAEGKVVRLEEKPANPRSNLALVGVYMFDANVFTAARSIKPSKRDELEITDAIQWLVDKGYNVRSFIVDGWWKDTGKLEDMLEANRMVLDTFDTRISGKVCPNSVVEFKVVVEEGACVENSTIRGPAVIGRNARVIDSYVGPFTSLSDDTVLERCEIHNSIVLENSRIADIEVPISDSLIGKNVEVVRSNLKPRAFRFMLGDSSKVGIF